MAYVPRSLRKSVSYRNILKDSNLKSEEQRKIASMSAYEKLKQGNPFHGTINNIKVKGKDAYLLSGTESILIHNLMKKNISKVYRIRPKSREDIVKVLISHLNDSYAYSVHRLDIVSFYERFDRSSIIDKLIRDDRLSRKTISLLSDFFSELQSRSMDGLPRGLGISAAVSELMMQEFDENMSLSRGVLYYARFVDDIIIVTEPSVTKGKLEEIITNSNFPSSLTFHSRGEKRFFSIVSRTSEKESGKQPVSFDYLGYEFNISEKEINKGRLIGVKKRSVVIRISKNKIEKIKKRLIASFSSFCSARVTSIEDREILKNRVRFLTSNYTLSSSSTSPDRLSGIYFNYKLINDESCLELLDNFYQDLLFNKRSRLSNRIRGKLSYLDRLRLSRYSFKKGFVDRKFSRFTYKDLSLIKRVWR